MRIFAIALFANSLGWTSAYAITCTQIGKVALQTSNPYQNYPKGYIAPANGPNAVDSGMVNLQFTSRPAEKSVENLTHIACAVSLRFRLPRFYQKTTLSPSSSVWRRPILTTDVP
jgi:hypothetical protein